MRMKVLNLILAVSVIYLGSLTVLSVAAVPSALYPDWAHHHWVWLSADQANQSSMIDYTQQYLDHGIKVGAVDIDSGWSRGYNDFVFNTDKYPNATGMVEFFHSKGIRIILWATSMINNDSSNYAEAHDKSYFIKNVLGKQALFSWWHGKGGLLDYSNPQARQWWHTQLDKVLALGIDGWKCDGTDPYILELVVPRGHSGVLTMRAYSDYYYGDFFNYTREKLGPDRLIMSRPADGFGPLYLDFSPRYVMYSGWVGDDDPTFPGLISALKSYLQSAWAGYANFGSDIGGYRTGNGTLGRTKELLLRWAAVGAFSPLMENGGDKEHRPWAFGQDALKAYTRFVTAHYELVPYLLTTGSNAMETGGSSITPLAKHDSFINKLIDDFRPDTLNYLLGPKLLVAPVTTASGAVFKVQLPADHEWLYWWNHTIYKGGSNVIFPSVPLDEIPVFVVNDAFIPLRVEESSVLLGASGLFVGALRWLLHSPASSQRSVMREFRGPGLSMQHRWSSEQQLLVEASPHPTETVLIEIHGLQRPIKSLSAGHVTLPSVDSVWLLAESGGGYYQRCSGDLCSSLVYPGPDSTRGHLIAYNF